MVMKNSGKKRILIVEDEIHIAEGLKLNLEFQGYEAKIAPDGGIGLREWEKWQPDLIVLDIMLPVIDGFAVLRNIRLKDERIPILILSAKGAADDKVRGLTHGVDDYLTKPFNLEEFLLRVNRLLTRASWITSDTNAGGNTAVSSDIYSFGKNCIDFEAGTATCGDDIIRLTEQELRLLRLFIANRGKPLSRKKILEIGWGYSGATTTRTVDNFIVRLRKYFEDNPKKPFFFRSVRSVGYLFEHE